MGCNFQASVFKMQTAALTARIRGESPEWGSGSTFNTWQVEQ